MSDPVSPDSASASLPDRPRNFWRRRVTDPVVAQLTQGLTPHKIALTIAVGSALALFPILGTTTLLCLIVGVVLKLNQPIMQAINYACTPLHLPFIFYSFRWGHRLFDDPDTPLRFKPMLALLRASPVDFLERYGLAALHAIIVWAVLVPVWIVVVYYVMRPILRSVDRLRLESAAKAAAEKADDHPVP
ncbi:DUF2062 domain-containing protein [Opitutus sp. ER46]|uniref:DUF2062 domain-containing protein n=1 Tax=Opitutus sp. ER46 TaxID=2161864 RepID=UPI000D2FBA26|nr:DUF2062 domain-containing protein [Opitutus sp. ER46]PTY01145.1 DUF2062 domain-containing protein [Opitutus sp. ER46]